MDNKSADKLRRKLKAQFGFLSPVDIKLSIKVILGGISSTLENRGRVEIRGFGSFHTTDLPARKGRNPKTGQSVDVPPRTVPHFKAGKDLKMRVDSSKTKASIRKTVVKLDTEVLSDPIKEECHI